MLKMVKVSINIEIKADPNDEEDLKNRVYEKLQLLMEEDALDFSVEDEDSDDYEYEDC